MGLGREGGEAGRRVSLAWARLQLFRRGLEDARHRAKPASRARGASFASAPGEVLGPGWQASLQGTRPWSDPAAALRCLRWAARIAAPVSQRLDVGTVHAAHGGERSVDAAQVVGAQVLLDDLRRLVLVAAAPGRSGQAGPRRFWLRHGAPPASPRSQHHHLPHTAKGKLVPGAWQRLL